MDHQQQFIDAIQRSGITPPASVVDDGKLHRFSSNGKKGDDSGWYILHGDGIPAGAFGCWRSGLESTWQADIGRKLTPDEISATKKRAEEQKKIREQERAELARKAAELANKRWTQASEKIDHEYITRKGIKPFGIRQDGDEILVPMRDATKKIIGLQRILRDGTKLFLKGQVSGGAYFSIGKLTDRIIICEGLATGESLHEATGDCTVVAFSASNLPLIAKMMKERYPSNEIVIAGDNDPAGLDALQACGYFGRGVPCPIETDFNDLHVRDGLEAVKAALEIKQIVPAPQDHPQRRAIDIFSPLPDVNDRMKPLSTIDNVAEIAHRLGINIRYNVIAKEEEILIPGEAFSIDNKANASFAWLTSWCARFRMPTANLGDYVTYISDQNLYNPVAEWIMSKPWDGISRLQDVYSTITSTTADDLKSVLMYRWMMSAIAAAFMPEGVSAAGVLVLQGDQYLGKTKWFKSLVPDHLGVVKDGMLLRPDDKDSVKQICSFWLVELGELDATFRRSDIAALKSFITAKSDVLRRAYARKESHFARRTVFFGSVNPKQFLHDPTGNRRYWTIECLEIDHSHRIDMQQVWAELYEDFKAWQANGGNAPWYLTPDEMLDLNKQNEEFTVLDPIEERIQSRLAWDAVDGHWNWKTATEVLMSIGIDKPTAADTTKAAQCIRKLNGSQHKRSGGRNLLRVPPKVDW